MEGLLELLVWLVSWLVGWLAGLWWWLVNVVMVVQNMKMLVGLAVGG